MRFISAFFLVFLVFCGFHARAEVSYERFIVTLSGVDYEQSQNVKPCFPVMAKFYHSNPYIVKVRMQYPHNRKLYMDFDIGEEVHIELHENYMRKGEWSLSDFIAIDDQGQERARMQLVFVPMPNPDENECGALVS